MEVQLCGHIPVTVVVQLDESGEGKHAVQRVIAHDDEFAYEINDEGFQVLGEDTPDVEPGLVIVAKEFAENEMWPPWEWGW